MARKTTNTTRDTQPQVIAYLRVSTGEQGRSGLGLAAQRTAITDAADQRGWTVAEWIKDTASGKSMERPGMQRAMEILEDGAGAEDSPTMLVAAKLDRLSRSTLDFLELANRARSNGWAIVVLDMGHGETLDMTTPIGKFTATILASVAELERNMISKRTREGMAESKKKLGRPRAIPPQIVHRIRREREAGASLATIAAELNRDEVPTAQGGKKWWPTTVKQVLDRDG